MRQGLGRRRIGAALGALLALAGCGDDGAVTENIVTSAPAGGAGEQAPPAERRPGQVTAIDAAIGEDALMPPEWEGPAPGSGPLPTAAAKKEEPEKPEPAAPPPRPAEEELLPSVAG